MLKQTDVDRRMTEHQTTLLHYASHGWSNAKIGIKLELSERTIKNYFTNLYKILKATNRAHAVALAISRGIIGKVE